MFNDRAAANVKLGLSLGAMRRLGAEPDGEVGNDLAFE
jgi:hypothetical protein